MYYCSVYIVDTCVFVYNCRKCTKRPHDPCSCEQWTQWNEAVTKMLPKIGMSCFHGVHYVPEYGGAGVIGYIMYLSGVGQG